MYIFTILITYKRALKIMYILIINDFTIFTIYFYNIRIA